MRIFWLLGLMLIGLSLQFIPYAQHSPIIFGIPFFLLGSLSRRYQEEINASLFLADVPLYALYAIVIALVLFSIPHDIYLGHFDKHTDNSVDIFFYPLLTACLIPILHERTKANKIDFWIGQLSYPFYISHQVIIDISNNWHLNYRLPILMTATLLISMILTALEVRLIEPWRKKFAN